MFEFGAFWAGIIWAFTSTAFICAALLLWAFITGGRVYHFGGIMTAGILLGALLGGAVSGRAAGCLGWMHGGAVGLVYSLAVLALLAAWSGGAARFSFCFILPLLAALGGVVGVNLPAAGRRWEKHGRRMR